MRSFDCQVWLKQAITQLPLEPLEENRLQRFETLYHLVLETNKTTNLTRITEPEAFYTRHILDSLTLAYYIPNHLSDFNLIDIGSGAGFPALPLAIAYPQIKIVAVESVQKKAAFIQEAAEKLELDNIKVLPERSETLGHHPSYREQFDLVTARAVAGLNVLAELCLPFCKTGGRFIAFKTLQTVDSEVEQAAQALKMLGGKWVENKAVCLEHLQTHVLVVTEKSGVTPEKYPRTPGLPAKKPL